MSEVARVLEEETHVADGFRWMRMKRIRWKDECGKSRTWEAVERSTRVEGTKEDAVAAVAILRRDVTSDERRDASSIQKEHASKDVSFHPKSDRSETEPCPSSAGEASESSNEPRTRNVVSDVSGKEDDLLVLVSQFRPPVGKHVLEMPAGLVDVADVMQATEKGGLESMEKKTLSDRGSTSVYAEETLVNASSKAAIREVREETGYTGSVQTVSPVVYSDPGISNACFRFVQMDIDATSGITQGHHGVEGEHIKVHLLPLSSPLEGVMKIARDGDIEIDARLYAYLAGMEAGMKMRTDPLV